MNETEMTTAETDLSPENAMPKEQAEAKPFSPVIRVQLTPDQSKKVIALIDTELETIKQEYADFDYYNKIEQSDADYEGLHDETKTTSDKKILLTTMMADIVAAKAKRQTFGATPVILLEPEDDIDPNDLRNREDRMDFIIRNDMELEDVNYNADKKACYNGVAIMKVPLVKDVETITRKKQYQPKDIQAYEQAYGNAIMDPQSAEYRNWAKLAAGEPVEVTETEEKTFFHGVKPYRVDLRKFYARLWIKDFRKHKVITEMIEDARWSDIEAKVESEFYDADAVTDLQKKTGDKYKTENFKLCESIVFIKLDSELSDGKPKQDKAQRYVVTYDVDTKTILRCIHFPYEHAMPYYVPKCAIPRDDTWFGYNFSERLQDVKGAAEGLLNSLMDSFSRASESVIITDSNEVDFSRKTIHNDDGAITVIPMGAGKSFTQLKVDQPDMNRIGLLNWMNNLAALISGIDPMLNSGAQSPDDPRAPAQKVALKAQASNMRIEDIIQNLQKADEKVAEQAESIYGQYVDISQEGDEIGYWKGGEKKSVKRGVYGGRVRYVCHGSRISFDKASDNQLIVATIQTLAQFFPETWQDVSVRHAMLTALANNTPGSVEKAKDTILKPLKTQLESRKEQLELRDQLMAQGLTPQDAEATIQNMITGKVQNQLPAGQQPPTMPQGEVMQ